MQISLKHRQDWFYLWAKQLPFALLPVFARMFLIATATGRRFTVTEVHHRWAATGALGFLVVLGICGLFIHAFRDRLRRLEVVALLLLAILTSTLWTGYFVAVDPATSELVKVSALWQWALILAAIALSFAFLLVLGFSVDAKRRSPKNPASRA